MSSSGKTILVFLMILFVGASVYRCTEKMCNQPNPSIASCREK